MPNWTQQQNNAITARGRNILVSAAAGSGKTAVLVERVIKKITDKENPVDIDKLLIVTFTNNAAAEMKSRITKSLKDILRAVPFNLNAQRQLNLISGAKICTIDSFCINLVRENFFELDINQDFTNLDENESSLLEDNIISDIIDECFENNDKVFINLFEQFSKPENEKPFINVVKKVRKYIYAQPFPYVWANNMLNYYQSSIPFEESIWYKYVTDEAKYLISLAQKCNQSNIDLLKEVGDEKIYSKLESTFSSDKAIIDNLFEKINNSWDEAANFITPKFDTLRTAKLDSDLACTFKTNRNTYKTIISKDIPALFICNKEEYTDSVNLLYPVLEKLIQIVKETDERLMAEKKERNAFTFADTEHFAINLLFDINDGKIVKKELANRLSNEFEEILVDEYQDTNEAQDMLFTYLSNGHNLFTVGDIKQSIYRFRLAMPDIFNNKRKSYADYDANDQNDKSKIVLDKNFRSSEGICNYVNFVFSLLMSEKIGELDYSDDDFLNYGADYKESNIPSAQINIINKNKGENKDKTEAYHIAKLIKQKIDSGEQVKDGDTYRNVGYSDFAILFRGLKSHIDDYLEVFNEMSIPVVCDNTSNLFESNEIKIILSFLKCIDNPTVDIPLLSTMMSPIYCFTADELAQIRNEYKSKNFYFSVLNSKNKKVVDFLDDIKNLKKLSVTMSVSNFIRYLVEEKGIVAFSNAMGNGEQRYQNIISFISFAQKFDSGVNIGLTSFIRYIGKIIESDKSVEAKPLTGSTQNAVTIMTVHHSKGLEFPICILAGSSSRYNHTDLSEDLLINTKYGFGIKVHNEDKMYNVQSLPYAVIKSKNANELMSENLRVLYVAMTRAKEQFITFASLENVENKVNNTLVPKLIDGEITPYSVKSCNSDSDLLLLCALFHPKANSLREISESVIKTKPASFDLSVNIIESEEVENNEVENDKVSFDTETVDTISKKLSYKYEYMPLSTVTSKMTASSLDDSNANFEFITSSKPAFMNKAEMTPAERGTAMHTFMQYCNYESAKKDIESEIKRLTDAGYINDKQSESLDRNKLSSLFSSDFAKRMFNSNKIYREIKVSSFLSADELYDVDFKDKILVQGIADCVFEEDGALVLVDYKTDRVKSDNELLERYKKQIAFYRKAIEKTLKKPVKEAVLYSFCLEKVCIYK